MLINEYKPEFYDRKVRKMRNLSNVYICGSPFVMSRTDAQNGLYSIFNQNFAAEKHFKNQSIEEDQKDISHMLYRSEGLKCKKT